MPLLDQAVNARGQRPLIAYAPVQTDKTRESIAEIQREFAAMRELAAACGERFGASRFGELSMGMSSDFEQAIREGASIVRVGSAIFGPRPLPAGSTSHKT